MNGVKANLIACIVFWSAGALAQTQYSVSNWVLETRETITEAYTANDPNSVFGLFCLNDKCVFYLHHALQCEPNKKYSLLMNGLQGSSAIEMRCTPIGNKLFWILEPFNSVLRMTQAGDFIGFAVALQSGSFGISRFSLEGAQHAIRLTLLQAAKNKPPASLPNEPKRINPQPIPVVPRGSSQT